jgi:hypothetical protein
LRASGIDTSWRIDSNAHFLVEASDLLVFAAAVPIHMECRLLGATHLKRFHLEKWYVSIDTALPILSGCLK